MFTLEEVLGINEFDQSPWTNWAHQASEFSWLDASLMSGWSMDDFNLANGHATGNANGGTNGNINLAINTSNNSNSVNQIGTANNQQIAALGHTAANQDLQNQSRSRTQVQHLQPPTQPQPQQLTGNADGNTMLTDEYKGVETVPGTPAAFWRAEG